MTAFEPCDTSLSLPRGRVVASPSSVIQSGILVYTKQPGLLSLLIGDW